MITLYIKKHNVTGLKYFGVTSKDNIYKYRGSGTYWVKHIQKYGYDVTTDIYFQSDDILKIRKIGIEFSMMNNIVNSMEWANLCIEDGGLNTSPASDLTKAKMSKARVGKGNTLILNEQEVLAIRADFKNNIDFLSEKYNVSRSAIVHILRGHTWKHLLPNDFIPISKTSNRVVLNFDKAQEIRALYLTGMTLSKVGEFFGVTKSTVQKIVKNKIWKDSNDKK